MRVWAHAREPISNSGAISSQFRGGVRQRHHFDHYFPLYRVPVIDYGLADRLSVGVRDRLDLVVPEIVLSCLPHRGFAKTSARATFPETRDKS